MSTTLPIPRPENPIEAAELMHQLAQASRFVAVAKEELRDLEPKPHHYFGEAFDLATVVYRRQLAYFTALEQDLLEIAGAVRVQFPKLTPPFVPLQLDAEQSAIAAAALLFVLKKNPNPEAPPSTSAPATIAHLVDLAGHLFLSELAVLAKREKLILGDAGAAEVLRAAIFAHPDLRSGSSAAAALELQNTLATFMLC